MLFSFLFCRQLLIREKERREKESERENRECVSERGLRLSLFSQRARFAVILHAQSFSSFWLECTYIHIARFFGFYYNLLHIQPTLLLLVLITFAAPKDYHRVQPRKISDRLIDIGTEEFCPRTKPSLLSLYSVLSPKAFSYALLFIPLCC